MLTYICYCYTIPYTIMYNNYGSYYDYGYLLLLWFEYNQVFMYHIVLSMN